jgi:hypothetical protein
VIVFTTRQTSANKIKEMRDKAVVHVGQGKKVNLEKAFDCNRISGVCFCHDGKRNPLPASPLSTKRRGKRYIYFLEYLTLE